MLMITFREELGSGSRKGEESPRGYWMENDANHRPKDHLVIRSVF